MPIIKRPIDPRRLRSALPRGFGWIDHRFLTDGYLAHLSPQALGLYCLLVCAADSSGLSYYSDQRLRDLLAMDGAALVRARRELLDAGLIAYLKPLSQVLALDPDARSAWPVEGTRKSMPQQPTRTPAHRSQPAAHNDSPPLPAGLDLRAMVEASLREGGVL
jgi:hypothetical protein